MIWSVSPMSFRCVCLLLLGKPHTFLSRHPDLYPGVNLNLMPTKGMTLPFISYGGSSLLVFGLCVGLLLALTRRGARLEVPR